MSKYLANLWKKPDENMGELWKRKMVEWRQQDVVTRIEKPTRVNRARALGYKAKQGFAVARVRVPKGKRKRPKVTGGRRPKRAGRFFTTAKSKQWIAEEKVSRKFPNMEVINSYYVGEDGTSKWYEVLLADRSHPAVKKDKDRKWLTEKKHRGRVSRGKTSAGKRARGLRKKGKGSEKTRPSIRANKRRGK